MTSYHVVAHHVSHLFPDVVSEPMTQLQADRAAEAAQAILGHLPFGARGWTVLVERVGPRTHAHHLYRK